MSEILQVCVRGGFRPSAIDCLLSDVCCRVVRVLVVHPNIRASVRAEWGRRKPPLPSCRKIRRRRIYPGPKISVSVGAECGELLNPRHTGKFDEGEFIRYLG